MLSSRDMTPSLVVGTSRISAGICTYIITNLHITTALFDVFATTSPPSCIYRQHFSPLAPPFRRRPAYTDSTFRCFQPYFNADLHIPTYTIFIDRQTYVSRGMRISGHTSPNIRISGHTYLGTYVSPDIRISGQTYLGAYVSKHTYLGAYVSRDIRISGHAYLGADVSRDIRLQTYSVSTPKPIVLCPTWTLKCLETTTKLCLPKSDEYTSPKIQSALVASDHKNRDAHFGRCRAPSDGPTHRSVAKRSVARLVERFTLSEHRFAIRMLRHNVNRYMSWRSFAGVPKR